MRLTRFISVITIILFGFSGCIESYLPKDILESEESYVVWGKVSNNKDYHIVKVSKTTSLEYPRNNAVTNCQVSIIDSEGNIYTSDYTSLEGEYYVRIEPEQMVVGKAFKVLVTTPDGIDIESEFDTLRACPEISNLYVEREDRPTSNPFDTERGVQFKVDVDADDTYGRYFNWEMEVTYEYHSAYPLTHYYDGEINELFQQDYSMYYCWKTEEVKNFFPLTTRGLTQNSFVGHDLHFVNNRTQRLLYQYSVLLFQSAISEGYFKFLDQLSKNSTNQEGLFGTQPITVQGNIYSTNYPERKILGFFSAENVTSKRFFFSNVMDVPFEIPLTCVPYMPLNGLGSYHPAEYPIYLANDGEGHLGVVAKSCIDCRILGGTTQRPSYWP